MEHMKKSHTIISDNAPHNLTPITEVSFKEEIDTDLIKGQLTKYGNLQHLIRKSENNRNKIDGISTKLAQHYENSSEAV